MQPGLHPFPALHLDVVADQVPPSKLSPWKRVMSVCHRSYC